MDETGHPLPGAGGGVSTKTLLLDALKALPDDADFDDVIERLQFVYEVQRGLDDIAAGRVSDHDDVRRRMAKWLAQFGVPA